MSARRTNASSGRRQQSAREATQRIPNTPTTSGRGGAAAGPRGPARTSCDECRRKKKPCDKRAKRQLTSSGRQNPPCTWCQGKNIACVISSSTRSVRDASETPNAGSELTRAGTASADVTSEQGTAMQESLEGQEEPLHDVEALFEENPGLSDDERETVRGLQFMHDRSEDRERQV